ncbi:MAG: ribosome recycling factor [Methylacidiphilales bacterium]|nr:ribosome recycling factor [Candidatus Methylacidiphilales bacterium]
MSQQFETNALQSMKKVLTQYEQELLKIRTGRASASLYDGIMVLIYGTKVPLKSICKMHVEEGKTVVIVPFDRQNLSAIERSIVDQKIGITPAVIGDQIRMTNPPLTEERRKEFVKSAKSIAEQFKVQLRTVRRDVLEIVKQSEKEKVLSQDDVRNIENKIQKILDQQIAEIDSKLQHKVKELTTF